jgi:hypothetical protein
VAVKFPDNALVMDEPVAPEPTTLQTIEYYDASEERQRRFERRLAWLAGILSLAAVALVVWVTWKGWRLNFMASVTAGVAVGLMLGTLKWRGDLVRFSAWVGAVLVFGMWTVIVLWNQFHGKPPASSRFVIAGCAVACAFSALGLALTLRRGATGGRTHPE